MTNCSVVTVLALVCLTKKRFGHYAILKILSLRSPRNKQNKSRKNKRSLEQKKGLDFNSAHVFC